MSLRIPLLVALLALAGCTGPKDSDTGPPATPPPACPVTYPDGSPFDCDASQVVTSGIAAAAPGLTQGWRCVTHYSGGAPGTLASYVHQDGRVGVFWDLKELRPGYPNFVEAHVFYGDGAMAMVIPFQAKGFAIFPEKPRPGDVEMHLVEKAFRIEVKEGDTWYEPENTSLVLGRFEGEAWFVYRYETSQGVHYLRMVEKRIDAETKRKYTAAKQFYEGPDHWAYADVVTYGAKYPTINFATEVSRSYSCPPGV